MNFMEKIGIFVLSFLEKAGDASLLLGNTLKESRQTTPANLLRQMAHLGVDSLPIVTLTLVFAGAVMTLQLASVMIQYGAQDTIGGVISIAMGRELGPVLVGVVLAGRVGAAITAEIGAMKVTEQIDALRVMAVNPIAYLVAPRFLACVFMVPILAFYGVFLGVISGYFVAVTIAGLPGSSFISSINMMVVPTDLFYGLIKAGVFGGIIALVGCYKGMNTKIGAAGVGQATTLSVVTSIILIFVVNYILSSILF